MIAPTGRLDQTRLRVLFADDDAGTLLLGRRMLEAAGHDVTTATDGQAALDAFRDTTPDIVLLDLGMPRLDGIAACRTIKAVAGGRFIPVIFVTSAGDEDLARCLEAGGDGFLSKPLNPLTLNAQLQAFRRIRDLHSTVQEQSRSLREHQARLICERQLAATVFERVLDGSRTTIENLRWFVLPATRFAGDLVLAAERPCGGLHVLLADFTGHGLPAAIGAIPVSDTFHAATAAGDGLDALVRALNARAAALLPTGMFVAATAVHLSADGHTLEVWNGGMPDGLLLRRDGAIAHRFTSRQPPLGVLGHTAFDATLERVSVHHGDRLYLVTDGITEGGGEPDATLGEHRLAQLLVAFSPAQAFDAIEAEVRQLYAASPPLDDLAVIELTCRAGDPARRLPQLQRRIQLHFDAAALRAGNALQQLLAGLTGEPAFTPVSPPVSAILCELFINSLEHGLLGLDSALKRDAASFEAYYRESERRTRSLATGWIRVEVEHRAAAGAHRLALRVSDSGPGFDFDAVTRPSDDAQLHGRGLLVVRELAAALDYAPETNTVTAVLTWEDAAEGAA